jgi:DHA1 family inner membrane transport protein
MSVDTSTATVTEQTTEIVLPGRDDMARPRVGEWRVQVALCLAAFLASLNFFAPTPFYPQMAHDLQTTVPLLGQVVTLMALLSAGLGLVVGPLADRYGFRWPLSIGLLAITVGLLGSGLAPSYPVLLGLSVVMGFGDALVFALPFAIATTRFRGDAQRRAIGLTIAALSMAPIIGVPVLTAVGSLTSWRVALIAAGGVAIAVTLFVASSLPADSRRPTTSLHIRLLRAAYAPVVRHRRSQRLLAVSALRGMWWIGLLTYLGAYLGAVVGLSPWHVGLVYTLAGAAYALGSVVAGSRIGALRPRGLVALSHLVAGLLLGPLLVFATPGVVLPLLFVACLAASIGGVGVVALLAAESPAEAAATMVLNGAVLNLGTAAGTVLGGALIALGGYGTLGIGLAGAALLAAALAWNP